MSAVLPNRTPAVPSTSPWPVFALTASAVFLVSLDTTIVIAAFPALRGVFTETAPTTLSWVLNAFTIVYAALLVPAGRLADTFGRKRVFLVGLAIFGLGSLACGVATSAPALIAFRIAQGIGAALLTPASLALILAAFPMAKRSVAVSLWGAVGAMAAALGPVAGGWLLTHTVWGAIFLVNVPVVAVAWWRAWSRLTESRAEDDARRFDALGTVVSALGVGLLVLGVVQAGTWSTEACIGVSALGLLVIGLFVWRSLGRTNDLTLFREPTFRWVNAATVVFGAVFTMMFLSFFLFLTSVWEYALDVAALAVIPGPLMVMPVAVIGGRVAARRGHRPLLALGGIIFAASNVWLLARAGTTPAFLSTWLPGLLVGGVGIGLILPSLSAAAVAKLPASSLAVGNAMNSAIRQIGGALGAALVVALVGDTGSGLDDFQRVFAILIVGSLVTGALGLGVNTRPVSTAPVDSVTR